MLDLTDATKQYMQVWFQLQYMLYNILDGLSLRIHGTVKSFGHPTYGLQY